MLTLDPDSNRQFSVEINSVTNTFCFRLKTWLNGYLALLRMSIEMEKATLFLMMSDSCLKSI